MEILVNVSNQKLKIATNLRSFVEGSQEFVRFTFNLGEDWDNLLTFAQFGQNGTAYNQYLDENNSVYLPSEIVAGICTLMLYGSGGNVRATTNFLTLVIDENILVSDAESTEISQSLYDQLVDMIQNIDETVIGQSASDWLAEHITVPTNPIIDSSLLIHGAAADSKTVGDRFNEFIEVGETPSGTGVHILVDGGTEEITLATPDDLNELNDNIQDKLDVVVSFEESAGEDTHIVVSNEAETITLATEDDLNAIQEQLDANAYQTGLIENEVADLKNALGEAVSNFTWTNGKYLVGTTGVEGSNASYAYAKASIESVAQIIVTTKCQNPAGICFFDNTDTFISGINGSDSSALVPYTLNVPSNAVSIGISCIINDKASVAVDTVITSQVATLNNVKQAKAIYNAIDQLALNQGIVHKNLTIYNPSANYTGRYVSAHYAAGTTIVITGQGVNANYPALVIAYDDSTTYSNYTSNQAYLDRSFTMPKSGTVYVSGNTLTYPVIKVETMMPDSQSKRLMTDGLYERDAKLMFKLTSGGALLIKKRISDTESIRVSLAHVGGNNLFGFSTMGIVEETQGERMNNTFDASQTLNMSSTDWFSPYKVLAVNNADGDVPAGNEYFTGGNHRSNNTGEGGGITATEESFSVCVGGETPLPNEVHNTDEIVVKWSNLVQANNTSKSDGTGRAVLRESWTMHITKDGFAVENNIETLEAITLKTYYGLQAYYPGSNVVYKGGATRTPISISSASNSGNTSCREAVAQGTYYDIDMLLLPLDLGAFNGVPYSIFTTSASKLYFNLIGSDTAIQANEHYFISGVYKFW